MCEMKIFGSGNSLEEKKQTKKDKNQDLTKDIISLYLEQKKLKISMVFRMGPKRQILNISKDVEQKLMDFGGILGAKAGGTGGYGRGRGAARRNVRGRREGFGVSIQLLENLVR